MREQKFCLSSLIVLGIVKIRQSSLAASTIASSTSVVSDAGSAKTVFLGKAKSFRCNT